MARRGLRLPAAVVLGACAIVGLALAFGTAEPPPASTSIGAIDFSAFDSPTPIRADESLAPVVLFDQGELPSDYRNYYSELPEHRYLKIVRPRDEASFPPNIAAPRLCWEDQVDNAWMVSLTVPGRNAPLRFVTGRTQWRPDGATWEAIKESARGQWVDLEVRGCIVRDGRRSGQDVYMDRIRFRISEHPADPIVVYRLVTPLFHAFKTPSIYYQRLDEHKPRMFLQSHRTYCTNCHSFPTSPDLGGDDFGMAIAVRQQVSPMTGRRILGLYKFMPKEGQTMGINSFFMSWHPDGEKVVVAAGTRVRVRPLITLETQEFYVRYANLLIVDRERLVAQGLPGACHPDYMETLPTWSPDGKTIVYARAAEMKVEFADRKFDLYQIAYNDGKGGKPMPVPGASQNGMSNYAARFSPDGKWLVFNKAEWSSLVAPTAKLWIMPADFSGAPRKLECNGERGMDSHHSWSSNSRWLLFASKRDDGIFARVYLSEIDEEGHASPPIELPSLADPMYCYNVPEFMRMDVPIDAPDILQKTAFLHGEEVWP